MDFGAGTARAGVAHHPEVFLLVSEADVDLRIQTGVAEDLAPDLEGFFVQLTGLAGIGFVDCGVEAVFGKSPPFGQQFPSPFDGFFFEVISEGPVTEHFEEGMVVGVEADVFQVVVFAAGADAFLGIGGAGIATGDYAGPAGDVRFAFAQEDRDELVHPGVGEEEVRGIGQKAGGGNDRMFPLTEEIQERLPNLFSCHGHVVLFLSLFCYLIFV